MSSKGSRLEGYLEHKTPTLSKDQTIDYINRYEWEELCKNHILEEDFIEEWKELMDIGPIVKYQTLSIDLLYSLKNEVEAENMPNLLDNQEWYMFINFMIMKSKEVGRYDLHVNRELFNEFRDKYHAQHFKK